MLMLLTMSDETVDLFDIQQTIRRICTHILTDYRHNQIREKPVSSKLNLFFKSVTASTDNLVDSVYFKITRIKRSTLREYLEHK